MAMPEQPVYRLSVKAPAARAAGRAAARCRRTGGADGLAAARAAACRRGAARRRRWSPSAWPPRRELVNSNYSIAEGAGSQDIVPTLVFDDGRFTYFRFPNNREVPAVFHVLGDGSETLVNARMEDDLLVVDRVSRRLMLRAGSAVVGVWNEAFDLDGLPPTDGTTVRWRAPRPEGRAAAPGRRGANREPAMTHRQDPATDAACARSRDDANAITPLEASRASRASPRPGPATLSWKGIAAVALLLLSLVAVGGVHDPARRCRASKNADDAESKLAANRPAAAATEPRKLDMTPAPRPVAASAPVGPPHPGLVSPAAEEVSPSPLAYGARAAATGPAAGPQRVAPEDAPAVLVSSRPWHRGHAAARRRRRRRQLPPGADHEPGRSAGRHQAQPAGLSAPVAGPAGHPDEEHGAGHRPGPATHAVVRTGRPQRPSPRRPARPAGSASSRRRRRPVRRATSGLGHDPCRSRPCSATAA